MPRYGRLCVRRAKRKQRGNARAMRRTGTAMRLSMRRAVGFWTSISRRRRIHRTPRKARPKKEIPGKKGLRAAGVTALSTASVTATPRKLSGETAMWSDLAQAAVDVQFDASDIRGVGRSQ